MYLVLVFINILLLVSGQILWKTGLTKLGGIHLDNFLKVIFSPYIIAGFLIYVVATVIWFVILSKAEFSVVYPLQSLAYVLGTLAAVYIFKENVPPIRWLGVAVIMSGIYLVTLK